MSPDDSVKLIWIISDGKQGHLNQSMGLADALLRLRRNWSVEIVPAMPFFSAVLAALTTSAIGNGQKPDLILAAGHGTHATALALSRKADAIAVVIMQPTLPVSCFDLALIPEHDKPKSKRNIVATKGALNRMQPAPKEPNSGMIMVGGPSKHFGWDSADVLKQIERLIVGSSRSWQITTSRRTPKEMLPALQALISERVRFLPVEETDRDWVGNNLPCSEVCWVTPDSVSMVYEALTAGCRVGVFTLPNPADNRVVSGVQALIAARRVFTLEHYTDDAVDIDPLLLDEADRCARELLTRFAL